MVMVVFAGDVRDGRKSSPEELLELADRDKRENYILLHEGFPKLRAPVTVVLVCFA
jgi:hypothetical protein